MGRLRSSASYTQHRALTCKRAMLVVGKADTCYAHGKEQCFLLMMLETFYCSLHCNSLHTHSCRIYLTIYIKIIYILIMSALHWSPSMQHICIRNQVLNLRLNVSHQIQCPAMQSGQGLNGVLLGATRKSKYYVVPKYENR